MRAHNARCVAIAVCVLAPLLALVAMTGSATAVPVQYCAQVPIVGDPAVGSSIDARCTTGTLGRVTLFASDNGVRSDSVQFTFPTACQDHLHLYHGPQVNNQVPPL